MTIEEINFLKSAPGRLMLEKYSDLNDEDLYQLLFKSAKQADINFLSAAVTLIKLRRRAKDKFSKSQEMFFTTLGLEQSTGEKISKHIASRFKAKWKVADLTCGNGGNLLFLAAQCRQVVAVDKNEQNIICAQENARLYNVSDKIEFVIGNSSDNLRSDVDAFFIDPARNRDGRSKTRSILNSEPSISELLKKIFLITKNVAIKISPAFDYAEIETLPGDPEIELISEDNVCKVAMLWFGSLKACQRRATAIIKDNIYSYTDNPEAKNITFSSRPQAYLYEPNKAIIKAHLITEIAAEYDLMKISPYLSFLTGNNLVATDKPGLMRSFKIISVEKYSSKGIKKFLSSRGIARINVMVKGLDVKPEEFYKKFKIKEGGDLFLIFTIFDDRKRYFILAERLYNQPFFG